MSQTNKHYTIGIDIGGTKMSAVLFDGTKVIADDKLATPKDNLEHFLIMLNALIGPLLEKAQQDKIKVKGIGLSVAGVQDYKEGKILSSPNIPIINNIKLAAEVKNKINLPVAMDNDANCFLQAEMKIGAGQKYTNAYGIIIGTGIGGAWWFNNKIYHGSHSGAGEPGQMIIDFSSGTALEPAYHKLTQNNPAAVAEEAYHGDNLAEKTFAEIGRDLGTTFANIVNLIDPEVFIIGGGVVEASDLFLSQVKKTMREYIHSPEAKKGVKIIKAKLGEHAGAIGASLLIAN